MIGVLTAFALALIPFFFSGFTNAVIDLINIIVSMLGPAAVRVIGFFPANPCLSVIGSCSDAAEALYDGGSTIIPQMLNVLAWLLPMQFLANLVACVMFSVMCYFLIAPLARWFKLLS